MLLIASRVFLVQSCYTSCMKQISVVSQAATCIAFSIKVMKCFVAPTKLIMTQIVVKISSEGVSNLLLIGEHHERTRSKMTPVTRMLESARFDL